MFTLQNVTLHQNMENKKLIKNLDVCWYN